MMNNAVNLSPGKSNQFVGQSSAFQSILSAIEAISSFDSSVVITGETGTGKEMVARMIHTHSSRKEKVFVPVDCTTLTGQLFESQLFGHVKGAFTSAHSDALGFFRAANGGTIFLDEIAEIPVELQSKLLRVLQEGVVTPVGSTHSYPVDARVLCATNRDLHEMVRENRFRSDLYYRLNVMHIEIPPLRQRREDILILTKHFLNKQALLYGGVEKKLSAAAQNTLMEYSWPGNIRELANVMERMYILSPGKVIDHELLPAEVRNRKTCTSEPTAVATLDEVKKRAVVDALNATHGKKMAAARLLRIDHRQLGRLVDRYNLQPCYK